MDPKKPNGDDEDEKKKEEKIKEKNKTPSNNQIQMQVEKGQAPKGVTRIDGPKGKEHAHFKNDKNLALYRDGSIRHGTIEDLKKVMTNDIKNWLINNGWKLPNGL
jgi:hypothetical protein